MDGNDELEIPIAAAGDAESDLDFAFRLQLQEAMAASLALQPSSSNSPLPDLNNDDDEDLSQIMVLQALELGKFHQESEDSKHYRSELRRVADDLRLRAHDLRFAREIVQMPEDEWEEFGDDFEKPIELARDEEEEELPFRLYFKGMVSRVYVSGERVQISAIGVAVCDPEENLVLKIQKPMPGAGASREVLEAKALIEGLDAVFSLGIKRVNVFFDFRVLLNHVTGKWGVKQGKIANLINQVQLLRKKFERCEMFLMPRCRVKFVFRLARDVIDSQITKNTELNGNNNVRETCTICLEVTESSQMFVVDGCLHQFCFSCMKQHVEVKLLNGMLPGCPQDGCKIRLNVESSTKFLSPRLLEIMAQRIKEASIPETEKVYCPYPKCSTLMSLSDTICHQQDSSKKDNSGHRNCIKCGGSFCINCKVPWHENMSCYDYKRLNPHQDAKLQSLAKQKMWRQCVRCNHMIELAEGCFHMTCRCGCEFCYTCGAEWKDKKATCSCPLWDENYIWYDDDDSEDFEDDDDDDSYGDYEDGDPNYESDSYY